MIILAINDNLKINIESIYSLECRSNIMEIKNWEDSYKEYIEEYSKDPPLLVINDNEMYKPEYGTNVDKEKLEQYSIVLNNHIIGILGEKPTYTESYFVLLNTGVKIGIDKVIFDKINNVFKKYEIK